MAAYDLTSTIGGYLDRHLIDPMLEFLSEKKVGVPSLTRKFTDRLGLMVEFIVWLDL